MNNKNGFNRLGRKPSHRRALKRNMVISLFDHEQIITTKAKAKEIRKVAEKIITRAKEDTVHNRRQVARLIHDKDVLSKVFADLGQRYAKRPGGYTRMVKMGQRQGDAAELVVLELVDKVAKTSAVDQAEKVAKKEASKPASDAGTKVSRKPAAKTVVASDTDKPRTKSGQRGGARGK
jgi:large subunit ribosomal protein L17